MSILALADRAPLAPARILIALRDGAIRDAAERVLRNAGHQVVGAHRALSEAILALSETRADVVIVDAALITSAADANALSVAAGPNAAYALAMGPARVTRPSWPSLLGARVTMFARDAAAVTIAGVVSDLRAGRRTDVIGDVEWAGGLMLRRGGRSSFETEVLTDDGTGARRLGA